MVLWRATRSFRANTQKRCPFRDRTSLVAQMVKHLPTMWETGIDPWVGKIPWGRKWQPTPVLLPGKSHGQRSLVGHIPWGHRVRHDWTTSLHVTFHDRGLECKSKKSRNTWSNRHIWPWSTEWSRAKANRVLPRECTGHSKHPLPTTHEKTLHMDITRWPTLKSYQLYSLQPKIEKLYTVSKNKTGSWLWLRSQTPYCQMQS